MQLGKALLGAIIGAAVSIGLLLAVYLTLGIDKVWLSIPFALITGLGVRMLVSTTGHASYVRGAMTMILALAAYIGGWLLVAQVATARANKPVPRPPAAEENPADTGEDAAKDDAPAEPAPPPQPAPRADVVQQPRQVAQKGFETWDFIWLAIAALVAYEMGRGSATPTAPAVQPAEPVPAGTHPDA
jgi:hypothetical protein